MGIDIDGFKLGSYPQDRQTVTLISLSNFPAIQYAPRLQLGAYRLQSSSDLNSLVVYTQNTACDHDLYNTSIYPIVWVDQRNLVNAMVVFPE